MVRTTTSDQLLQVDRPSPRADAQQVLTTEVVALTNRPITWSTSDWRSRPWRARLTTMSSRIAVIAIDAGQPRPVANFWCAVLGWRVVEEDNDGVSIAAPDGSGPSIDVCAVPEGKAVKNRLHLDLGADGVTPAEELERLLALGARRADVGQNPDVSWVVLTDPEGNEFCLLSRSVQDAQSASKPAAS